MNQLKIFKGASEVIEEEGKYKEMIVNQFRKVFSNDNPTPLLLPFATTPTRFECLGLQAVNPKAEILEGYVRLAWDFAVKEADEQCLFPSS